MRFVHKTLLASAGQGGVVALNLAGTMFLARALGHDLGQYDLFRNVAAMTVAIAALGIGNANLYMLNARQAALEKLLGNAIVVLAIGGGVLLVLFPLFVLGLPGYFGEVPPAVVVLFALGVAGLLGTALLRPLVIARLKVAWWIGGDLAGPGVVLVGCAVLHLAGSLTPAAALCLQGAGAMTSLAITAAYLLPLSAWHPRTDLRLFRETLRQGLRFFVSNATQLLIGTSIVAVLRLMTQDEPGFGSVALYTRAAALSGLTLMLPIGIGPMLFARWAGMASATRREQVEFAARVTVWYSVITSAVLVFGGTFLLRLLYGPVFVAAQPALIVMVAANGVFALFAVYINLLASDGQAGIVGRIQAGGLVVGCWLSWALIPHLAAVGAAAALLGAHLFCCVSAMIFGWRRYGVRPRRCLALRPSDLAMLWGQLRSGPST